jgi:hypothetical protein
MRYSLRYLMRYFNRIVAVGLDHYLSQAPIAGVVETIVYKIAGAKIVMTALVQGQPRFL